MADLWHSWGKSPRMKKLEKEYNARYYQEHKDKWKNGAKKALFKNGAIGAYQDEFDKVQRARKTWRDLTDYSGYKADDYWTQNWNNAVSSGDRAQQTRVYRNTRELSKQGHARVERTLKQLQDHPIYKLNTFMTSGGAERLVNDIKRKIGNWLIKGRG